MGLLESLDHAPDIILNGHKLNLNILDLIILLLSKSIALLDLFSETVAHVLLFLFGQFTKLLMSLDFLLDLLVLLLNHVNFRVDLVDIVIKRIVLLVSFDECRHDFLNGPNSSLLLDLIEGILNNLDVSHVHIHQVLLFFIVIGPFLESLFKKCSRVRELARSCRCSIRRSCGGFALGFLELSVILFSELFLQIKDAALKFLLLLLILCFQGKNLIVELLRYSLPVVRYIIQLEGLVLDTLHFAVVVRVHTLLVLLLLAHHVYLVAERLVFGLELVQVLVVLVELVLQDLHLNTVLLHLGSRWTFYFSSSLLFLELFHSFLVGIFQDHESLLLMLELGGEVVRFSLQASDFTLVHGSAHPGLIGVTLIHFRIIVLF